MGLFGSHAVIIGDDQVWWWLFSDTATLPLATTWEINWTIGALTGVGAAVVPGAGVVFLLVPPSTAPGSFIVALLWSMIMPMFCIKYDPKPKGRNNGQPQYLANTIENGVHTTYTPHDALAFSDWQEAMAFRDKHVDLTPKDYEGGAIVKYHYPEQLAKNMDRYQRLRG